VALSESPAAKGGIADRQRGAHALTQAGERDQSSRQRSAHAQVLALQQSNSAGRAQQVMVDEESAALQQPQMLERVKQARVDEETAQLQTQGTRRSPSDAGNATVKVVQQVSLPGLSHLSSATTYRGQVSLWASLLARNSCSLGTEAKAVHVCQKALCTAFCGLCLCEPETSASDPKTSAVLTLPKLYTH
jgi:hypothetical protein